MTTNVTQKQAKLTLSNQNYSLRKYKLLELIDSQPLYVAKSLHKNLPKLLDVSRQSFSNYLNASLDSSLQIPSDMLLIIAKLFSVDPYDLLNYKLSHLSLSFFVPMSFSTAKEATGLIN